LPVAFELQPSASSLPPPYSSKEVSNGASNYDKHVSKKKNAPLTKGANPKALDALRQLSHRYNAHKEEEDDESFITTTDSNRDDIDCLSFFSSSSSSTPTLFSMEDAIKHNYNLCQWNAVDKVAPSSSTSSQTRMDFRIHNACKTKELQLSQPLQPLSPTSPTKESPTATQVNKSSESCIHPDEQSDSTTTTRSIPSRDMPRISSQKKTKRRMIIVIPVIIIATTVTIMIVFYCDAQRINNDKSTCHLFHKLLVLQPQNNLDNIRTRNVTQSIANCLKKHFYLTIPIISTNTNPTTNATTTTTTLMKCSTTMIKCYNAFQEAFYTSYQDGYNQVMNTRQKKYVSSLLRKDFDEVVSDLQHFSNDQVKQFRLLWQHWHPPPWRDVLQQSEHVKDFVWNEMHSFTRWMVDLSSSSSSAVTLYLKMKCNVLLQQIQSQLLHWSLTLSSYHERIVKEEGELRRWWLWWKKTTAFKMIKEEQECKSFDRMVVSLVHDRYFSQCAADIIANDTKEEQKNFSCLSSDSRESLSKSVERTQPICKHNGRSNVNGYPQQQQQQQQSTLLTTCPSSPFSVLPFLQSNYSKIIRKTIVIALRGEMMKRNETTLSTNRYYCTLLVWWEWRSQRRLHKPTHVAIVLADKTTTTTSDYDQRSAHLVVSNDKEPKYSQYSTGIISFWMPKRSGKESGDSDGGCGAYYTTFIPAKERVKKGLVPTASTTTICATDDEHKDDLNDDDNVSPQQLSISSKLSKKESVGMDMNLMNDYNVIVDQNYKLVSLEEKTNIRNNKKDSKKDYEDDIFLEDVPLMEIVGKFFRDRPKKHKKSGTKKK